jgi:UDP:flavonoid glycosyltransferase YjiC (YdhE family)
MIDIAYFVSPHGFGHAARSCAVMEKIRQLNTEVRFNVFTRVPEWFFKLSVASDIRYHDLLTDIGLVQHSPIHVDLPGTLAALDQFIPFDQTVIKPLSESLKQQGCQLIVCDISPLGLAVAEEAGVPSVLIENFTWDWIYQPYADRYPAFNRHIDYLQELFAKASYRIQTLPICTPARADLVSEPVCRMPKRSTGEIRSLLDCTEDQSLALITMGGMAQHDFTFLAALHQSPSICFVVPGASESINRLGSNVILLPDHSDFYHPDLVYAADLVIAKLGYSTIAEAYQAGIPYLYLERPGFRESPILAEFVNRELNGSVISEAEFQAGSWLNEAKRLCGLKRLQRKGSLGTEQIAKFLLNLLG